MIYGCPGFQTTKGSAVVLSRTAPNAYTTILLDDPLVRAGDRFGAYVSMKNNNALVGAPFYDFNPAADTNNGAVFLFTVNGTQISSTKFEGAIAPQLNDLFGSAVAIAQFTGTFVVGEPNADGFLPGTTILNRGAAHVYTRNASGTYDVQTLIASDFAADDSFGFSVAISGNTIAVGAPFDDNEKGANAGSVYIFRKKNSGIWEQEAKLVASDGFANDQFSYFGLGINNSTVVVGSHFADGPNFPFDPNENRGQAYIFTTVNNVWTEESRIRASDGAPGDEFGLAIDLDEFNSLIIGAPNHDINFPSVGPVDDIGFAYVYQLSCASVPAPAIEVTVGNEHSIRTDSITLCENTRPALHATGGGIPGQTYQWRRNGVNISGATDTFLFKFFTAADAGTYDVVVSNSCSSRISPPLVVKVNSNCNVTPLSQTVPSTPGGGSLNVTACAECYWGVIPFENPTSFGFRLTNAGGRGNGTLNFTVTRNPYAIPRTIEYEIAGRRALITQTPSPNFIVTDDSSANFSGSLAGYSGSRK